jgi:hypothetical protein
MGSGGSTTLADRGSDLHRVYLTRLCCAFRFSQPLDALIPPLPFRPCFMPVTPLSFCLQRIPPSDSRNASRRRLPLLPLRVVRKQYPVPFVRRRLSRHTRARLQGLNAFGRSVRCGRCYPVTAGRASPGLSPSEGFPLRASASCFHRPTFLGFDMTPKSKDLVTMSALQSFKEPGDWLASFESCLPP